MTRKAFTRKTKAEVLERSGGTCEAYRIPNRYGLPKQCENAGEEWDHIRPVYVEGDNNADNCAFLCKPCHRLKTLMDNREAKKGNRIRKKSDPKTRKPSRMKSRGFEKPPKGYKHNWKTGRMEKAE